MSGTDRSIDAAYLLGCGILHRCTWTNKQYTRNLIAKRLKKKFVSEKASWMGQTVKANCCYNTMPLITLPFGFNKDARWSGDVVKPSPHCLFKFNVSFLQDKSFCMKLKETP